MTYRDPIPEPTVEKKRIETLYSYHLIGDEANKQFDSLVNLAASICNTPLALLNLIDANTQWTISCFGDFQDNGPREGSLCNHTVALSKPLVVDDLSKDGRFMLNKSVVGEDGVRFYAGMPLMTEEGYALGALCVVDMVSRKLDSSQIEALETITSQIMKLFRFHKEISELEDKQSLLEQNIQNLEEYTGFISHDLRNPFRNIELITELLYDKHKEILDEESLSYLHDIITESRESRKFIVDLLKYSKSINTYNGDFEILFMDIMIPKIIDKLSIPSHITVELVGQFPEIYYPKTAINHIFSNLIENARKYNDADNPVIKISYQEEDDHHIFKVYDNGSGVDAKTKSIIDKLFLGGLQSNSKFIKSIGLGLAIVNKLAHLMGGNIVLESENGQGTQFTFSLPINSIQEDD